MTYEQKPDYPDNKPIKDEVDDRWIDNPILPSRILPNSIDDRILPNPVIKDKK